MLTIRKAQFEALSQAMLEGFLAGATVRLSTQFPKETADLSEEELKQIISAGIDRAAKYKITEREDVYGFIECMFRFGFDYDDGSFNARMTRILRTRNLSGAQKISQIRKLAAGNL